MPRLMGLDYGRARIGVAVGDELGITVRAVGHVDRIDDAQAAGIIAALAQQEKVSGLVIGRPLHASGDAGENVRWGEAFLTELAQRSELPVTWVDERYSSSEAEEALRAEGRWPAKPGVIDARAAAIILRRYLDGEV
jgi:putative Holliday junction resolvase